MYSPRVLLGFSVEWKPSHECRIGALEKISCRRVVIGFSVERTHGPVRTWYNRSDDEKKIIDDLSLYDVSVYGRPVTSAESVR